MTSASRADRRASLLRRLLGRRVPLHSGAPQPVEAVVLAGCRPISDCREGTEGRAAVTVSGTLRAVGERMVGGSPAVQAELDDGTGSLDVIWLGRRSLAGVVIGRQLTASGRIAALGGRPVLFNPRYRLEPHRTEQVG